MTKRRLLRTMSGNEFTWWRAQWNIRPWGEFSADLRVAKAAARICNLWSKRGVAPIELMPVVKAIDEAMKKLKRTSKKAGRRERARELSRKIMAVFQSLS